MFGKTKLDAVKAIVWLQFYPIDETNKLNSGASIIIGRLNLKQDETASGVPILLYRSFQAYGSLAY